jgi:thymidylate kinase
MITVALIGGDGAGKSTIANRLRKEFPLPIKYLYMGINIESSNVALPTSRLIERMKRNKQPANEKPRSTSLHHQTQSPKKKSAIWRYIRLANRCAEEWYRQFLSWKYRRKGYIVLYDRHFLFDFAQPVNESEKEYNQRPLDDRLHRWLLHGFYPEPDLVIFLYAPPDVLYARKGEASLEYLDNLQKTYIKQGEKSKNFVTMDATQSLEEVYRDVTECIMGFSKQRNGGKP